MSKKIAVTFNGDNIEEVLEEAKAFIGLFEGGEEAEAEEPEPEPEKPTGKGKGKTKVEPEPEPEPESEEYDPFAEGEEAPEEPEENETSLTAEDIRRAAVKYGKTLAQQGRVKELLTKLGVKSGGLKTLPESKYQEFMDKLAKLK